MQLGWSVHAVAGVAYAPYSYPRIVSLLPEAVLRLNKRIAQDTRISIIVKIILLAQPFVLYSVMSNRCFSRPLAFFAASINGFLGFTDSVFIEDTDEVKTVELKAIVKCATILSSFQLINLLHRAPLEKKSYLNSRAPSIVNVVGQIFAPANAKVLSSYIPILHSISILPSMVATLLFAKWRESVNYKTEIVNYVRISQIALTIIGGYAYYRVLREGMLRYYLLHFGIRELFHVVYRDIAFR